MTHTVRLLPSDNHGRSFAVIFPTGWATETYGNDEHGRGDFHGRGQDMKEPSTAVEMLNNVIDASLIPRKAIADGLGMSIGTLSKMTTGINAFGLDTFEQLDRDLQVCWFKQYGPLLGLDVRERDIVAKAQDVIEQFDALVRAVRLAGIAPRQAKAELPAGVERRRSA